MKAIECNCLIGQTIYKICPKCNDQHEGTCNNCAWQVCARPCDVNPQVCADGSHISNTLQTVKLKVCERDFIQVNKFWNVFYFENICDAEFAITQLQFIFGLEDRVARYNAYKYWRDSRLTNFSSQIKLETDKTSS